MFFTNFDGTQTPIKILRDSGTLQSLITINCAMSCDCLDTTDHRLIRGITKEVNRISMVEISLCSQLLNGVVNIGVHDGIPDGYDGILGNDLVPTRVVGACRFWLISLIN